MQLVNHAQFQIFQSVPYASHSNPRNAKPAQPGRRADVQSTNLSDLLIRSRRGCRGNRSAAGAGLSGVLKALELTEKPRNSSRNRYMHIPQHGQNNSEKEGSSRPRAKISGRSVFGLSDFYPCALVDERLRASAVICLRYRACSRRAARNSARASLSSGSLALAAFRQSSRIRSSSGAIKLRP
jgi:hypothetical protein